MKLVFRCGLATFALLMLTGMQPANCGNYRIDRFEKEIENYEAIDQNGSASASVRKQVVKTDKGATVFVGSSTWRLWSDLEQRFAGEHAVNRGFGGATIDEINHYARRLVLRYKPARIVFYAGTNDIAEGDSGKDVYQDFLKFVDIVRAESPQTEIFFVSASVAPVRMNLADEYDEVNRLVKAYAMKTGNCRFIDVTDVMRSSDGKLKAQYFGPDNLHMNKDGYDAWEPVIKEALK